MVGIFEKLKTMPENFVYKDTMFFYKIVGQAILFDYGTPHELLHKLRVLRSAHINSKLFRKYLT